ncbi:unknown protein [Microcystis aeruginosa NIES-843]|uniref:Uncharacterized protein n=1 Tax=Microcystis aeruginosa (strain NIES-843 / IAM M-2473) TaxID=449447 RepID=B0JXN8_MICAN|nr:unknown protein [Microcystis aeruginosa NIES-843]
MCDRNYPNRCFKFYIKDDVRKTANEITAHPFDSMGCSQIRVIVISNKCETREK